MKVAPSASTIALLLAPPLFWAGNAVTARALVGDVSAAGAVFRRWALALALIAPFAHVRVWQHRAIIARQRWHTSPSSSSLASAATTRCSTSRCRPRARCQCDPDRRSAPVVTSMLGAAFFSAPVGRQQWIGALLSALGVLLVIARGDPVQSARRCNSARGDLIMLVATGYLEPVHVAAADSPRRSCRSPSSSRCRSRLGALMILPFALLEYPSTGQTAAPTASNLAALLYVALLPSLAAYFCWDRGVSERAAPSCRYFVNLTPVFTGLLSWLFLAEPIGCLSPGRRCADRRRHSAASRSSHAATLGSPESGSLQLGRPRHFGAMITFDVLVPVSGRGLRTSPCPCGTTRS